MRIEHRAHLLGVSAGIMRRVLVDHARRRQTLKRAVIDPLPLAGERLDAPDLRIDSIALDTALERLEQEAPKPARVVQLRDSRTLGRGNRHLSQSVAGHRQTALGLRPRLAAARIGRSCRVGQEGSNVNSDYWTEVEAIFGILVDSDAGDRAAVLHERCAGRPDLRAEVESLLAAHVGGGGRLRAETLAFMHQRQARPAM